MYTWHLCKRLVRRGIVKVMTVTKNFQNRYIFPSFLWEYANAGLHKNCKMHALYRLQLLTIILTPSTCVFVIEVYDIRDFAGFFCVWTNETSASLQFAQLFSLAKTLQRSGTWPWHWCILVLNLGQKWS